MPTIQQAKIQGWLTASFTVYVYNKATSRGIKGANIRVDRGWWDGGGTWNGTTAADGRVNITVDANIASQDYVVGLVSLPEGYSVEGSTQQSFKLSYGQTQNVNFATKYTDPTGRNRKGNENDESTLLDNLKAAWDAFLAWVASNWWVVLLILIILMLIAVGYVITSGSDVIPKLVGAVKG